MEIWTVYDRDRKPTGKTLERGLMLGDGEFHMVIHVCIINSQEQMLIQQRQPFKEGWCNFVSRMTQNKSDEKRGKPLIGGDSGRI